MDESTLIPSSTSSSSSSSSSHTLLDTRHQHQQQPEKEGNYPLYPPSPQPQQDDQSIQHIAAALYENRDYIFRKQASSGPVVVCHARGQVVFAATPTSVRYLIDSTHSFMGW